MSPPPPSANSPTEPADASKLIKKTLAGKHKTPNQLCNRVAGTPETSNQSKTRRKRYENQ
uniref:Uncharacterized protein n=1 Tax=uncultured bacterium contig00070 TaxID=1181551 RepID=A0A806KKE7_9BACT|nr:hypothetical protein [uncultured bacterium contig00070]